MHVGSDGPVAAAGAGRAARRRRGHGGRHRHDGTDRRVDFTGYLKRLDQAIPTLTYDGFVKTQSFPDGSVRVTVREDVTNVLACAYRADGMVFGHKGSEVTAGAAPTVGTARFTMTFTVPAGAPTPTFCQALSYPADNGVTHMTMRLTTTGPLRAASGYADGTPGSLTVVQNGIYGRPPQLAGDDTALGDDYPVEHVIVARSCPDGADASRRAAARVMIRRRAHERRDPGRGRAVRTLVRGRDARV
jgi:hypothetical protein